MKKEKRGGGRKKDITNYSCDNKRNANQYMLETETGEIFLKGKKKSCPMSTLEISKS